MSTTVIKTGISNNTELHVKMTTEIKGTITLRHAT